MNESTKKILSFSVILITGLSGMLLSFITPKYRTNMNAIVPIPRVFVEEHYLVEKEIRVYSSPDQFLSFDLKSKTGWPFGQGLLIEFYPLLDSLDRAHLVDHKFWVDTINYHFCLNKKALNKNLQKMNIQKVEVYSKLNGVWMKVKEHQCSL